MPVPDHKSFMWPILEMLADVIGHAVTSVNEAVADRFGLSKDDRSETLTSGR